MTRRRAKQIIFGLFYFSLLAFICLVFYFIFLRPSPSCSDRIQNQGETGIDCGGSCKACGVSDFKTVEVNSVRFLALGDNAVSLVAEVANPNLEAGTDNLEYVFKLYDDRKNVLKIVSGNSYIHAGEIKFIIQPLVEADISKISSVELETNAVKWRLLPEFGKPRVDTRSLETSTEEGLKVDGFLENKENSSLSGANILVFVFDEDRNLLAVSQTTLSEISELEVRSFSVSFPKGEWVKLVDASETKVFAEARF